MSTNIFQKFLNNINIKHYFRITSLGAVYAECYSRTIRDLYKRTVFEKGECNWTDVLLTIPKQYNDRIQSSTKLTPLQASLKMKEG